MQKVNQEQLILKIKNSKKLPAPGNQLTKLFEKTLNTEFIETNITFLIKKLPQLIIENLEIATDFQIRNKKETIEIEFENSIYEDKEFTKEFSEIISQIGDPLTSATACAIAKATQKTLAITSYEINKQKVIRCHSYLF